jgi:hypothetical protein
MAHERNRALLAALALLAAAGCARFRELGGAGGASFTSVSSATDVVHPGLYAVPVAATFLAGGAPLTGLHATLSFHDASGADRTADFPAIETDLAPDSLASGATRIFLFEVEVSPDADAGGPVTVAASATWTGGGTTQVGTPLVWSFAPVTEILVGSASDDPGDAQSLRSAIVAATASSGVRRIRFSTSVFTAPAPSITLGSPLPALTAGSGTIVVDAIGRTVVLTPAAALAGTQGWGLTVDGDVVIAGLEMDGFAALYPYFDLSADSCAGGMSSGGALRVASGSLVLDSCTISDPGVAKRNCYATTLDLGGGSGHRLVHNRLLGLASDAAYVASPCEEISDNVVSGSNDGFVLSGDLGFDCRLERDVIAVQQYGVLFLNSAGAAFRVTNDTFDANGQAIVRSSYRPLVVRNSLFLHDGSAIDDSSGLEGAGIDVGYLALDPGTPRCSPACPAITAPFANDYAGPLMLLDTSSLAGLVPAPGSPLVDSAEDLIDVNGVAPGRFQGNGPDRGALQGD